MMAQFGGLKAGDEYTIAGVYESKPDPRWWPRFRAWVLRRPAPRVSTGRLRRFRVTEVV